MIRSLVVWASTWVYMMAAGLVALPWTLATGRLGFIYAAGRSGIRLLLTLAGVRVEVSGRELLPPDGICVFMANHQSNLDPPILMAHLPGEVSVLAKAELFRVPVLGRILKAGKFIPVDRSNRKNAQASIARAAATVRQGRPFMIFPEGTRSPDGQLGRFKKGAFFLAEQAQAPIVAITLVGTGECMPRRSWRIRPGTVKMFFHPPLWPADWAAEAQPRDFIAAAIRDRIATQLSPPQA